ncbi:MAG: BatA domain-containing protein [Planctomycetes bacterium]|nr:BatA domain-containing protein [Planctomycetota bacterium]
MGFGNPLVLLGLLALAVPIVIHLLARRTSRPVDFSSVMFLQPILVRVARRHRLKEILVLCLRCAALAALVLGLSAPVVRPGGARSRGGAAVAVVIDGSYSMGWQEGGISRFERARRSARELIGSLREGDECAVLLTAGPRPPPVLRPLRSQALADLEAAAVFPGSGDALEAVRSALALLRSSALPNRVLAVLSDLGEREWRELAGKASPALDLEGVSVVLADLGGGESPNLALREVRAATPQLVAGRPIEVQALVENPGGAAAEAAVALRIGEKVVAERKLRLAPGARTSARFPYVQPEPGWVRGSVTLSPDALSADDERFFAFRVAKGVPVLLVNGMPSPIRYLDELFFAKLALAADREAAGAALFEAAEASPADLAAADLARHRAVVLANVAEVAPEAAARLRAFVEAGGGLLVFTGEAVRPESYEAALAGLLPAAIKARAGPPSDDVFVSVRVLRPDHPLFRALGREADLSSCQLFSFHLLEPREGSQVLAATSWGTPLLVEGAVGAGKVLLLATSADADWSNLPLRGAYLPFLHEALAYLAGRGLAARELVVGDPGAPERPGIVARAEGGEEAFAAVNVDPAESSCRRIEPEEVRSHLGGSRAVLLGSGESLARAVEDARIGIPLSSGLVWAVLAALLLETFLANRRRRTRPAGGPRD